MNNSLSLTALGYSPFTAINLEPQTFCLRYCFNGQINKYRLYLPVQVSKCKQRFWPLSTENGPHGAELSASVFKKFALPFRPGQLPGLIWSRIEAGKGWAGLSAMIRLMLAAWLIEKVAFTVRSQWKTRNCCCHGKTKKISRTKNCYYHGCWQRERNCGQVLREAFA